MNDQNEMDRNLKRLGQLLRPDAEFADRVMRRIDAVESKSNRNWWLPIGTAAAASVALMFGWLKYAHQDTQVNPPQTAQLVRSSTQWQAVSERPVMLAGEVPAREISRQLFDRVVWTDPKNHATFERVVPRQTVNFVTLEKY